MLNEVYGPRELVGCVERTQEESEARGVLRDCGEDDRLSVNPIIEERLREAEQRGSDGVAGCVKPRSLMTCGWWE